MGVIPLIIVLFKTRFYGYKKRKEQNKEIKNTNPNNYYIKNGEAGRLVKMFVGNTAYLAPFSNSR